MTKRVLYLLVPLAVIAACDKPQQPVPDDKQETKATLSVFPTKHSFSKSAEELTITVSSSGSWTAAPSEDCANWITVTPNSGTGNSSVSVKVYANKDAERRGSIIFKDKGKTVTATFTAEQAGHKPPIETDLVPSPDPLGETRLSSTTYQLLIYSFADSDNDGIGDFKGIQNHLDYLEAIGATALWLSPAHPADSYHGYNVTDYETVNPDYGTETDFKNLINAAHGRGIKIYMDYVLNHSGKGHPWFSQALMDPKSPYRDWYFISANPSADYKKYPMLNGTSYNDGEWKSAVSGSPRLTITKTDEAEISGDASWNLWYWDASGNKELQFVDKGDGTFYLVKQMSDGCGMLLRRYRNWNDDSKFGAVPGNGPLVEGQPLDLIWNGSDITFSGKGRYRIELSNVSVSNVRYMGAFDAGMPDFNYGDLSNVANNACFQALASSADKWIQLGVDGFRLDAVKHICGGLGSFNNTSNQTFLKEWYRHCNATYQAAGHTDDIFMVGEAADGHGTEKLYYEGLPSNFEFDYFNVLKNALEGNTGNYVKNVTGFLTDHKNVRQDAITSLFMTNHDQDRAAEAFNKSEAKEKQAAAMLLTTPGKVFIYQGEELGYYGYGEHEYIRTPILWAWDQNLTQCAKAWAGGKIDTGMLTNERSVKTQEAKENSLLNVYRTWSRLRNTYSAFTDGTMTAGPAKTHFATWYLTDTDGSKFLVVHYTGTNKEGETIDLSDNLSHPVALLGTGKILEDPDSHVKSLLLGPSSSVVFKL